MKFIKNIRYLQRTRSCSNQSTRIVKYKDIYIVYISEIKHHHFPGIKTCCYATPEMTPEMSGDYWSCT